MSLSIIKSHITTKPINCLRAILGLFVFASLTLATTSSLAEPTPYLNMEVGVSYWDVNFLQDDVALSISGALGLRLNQYVSMEVGYQNFGSMNFVSTSAEGELEAESFSAAALLSIPLGEQLKGFILAGAEEVNFTEQSTSPTFNFEKETENYFGLGMLLSRNERSAYRLTLASHADGDIIRLTIGGNLDLSGL